MIAERVSTNRLWRSSSFAFIGALVVLASAACDPEPTERPPVIVPPKTVEAPKWLGEAASRCALAASCATEHDAARFTDPSLCVASFGQRMARGEKDAVYTCLGSAKTCDAARACIHDGEDPRAVRYCTSHVGVLSACDGDVLVACGGDDASESVSTACAEIGASCKESAVAGGLIVRACFSEKLCPKSASGARCDGDGAVISCHDGAVERVTCAAGTKCVMHSDTPGEQAASCELGGRPLCTELDGKRCDGDKLIECVPHGHAGRVRVTDCTAAGLVCAGRGARSGCYVPTGVSCEPGPAKCDGDALSFCADGQAMHVSCTQIGGSCSPAANGPNAACAISAAK